MNKIKDTTVKKIALIFGLLFSGIIFGLFVMLFGKLYTKYRIGHTFDTEDERMSNKKCIPFTQSALFYGGFWTVIMLQLLFLYFN
jgi:hypothetical protein